MVVRGQAGRRQHGSGQTGGIMAEDMSTAANHTPGSQSLGHMAQQVADALLMLDYAAGSGVKTANDLTIPQDRIPCTRSKAWPLRQAYWTAGQRALAATLRRTIG
jgi:hypothetical protein